MPKEHNTEKAIAAIESEFLHIVKKCDTKEIQDNPHARKRYGGIRDGLSFSLLALGVTQDRINKIIQDAIENPFEG